MSQQYPQQPNQPGPYGQQPPTGYGYGYPQQPGYGTPPPVPQPPKKRGIGKVLGLGCAGVLGLFVIIGVAASGGDDDSSGGKGSSAAAEKAPREEKAAGSGAKESDDKPAEEKEEPVEQGPVKITAKKTAFAKSILADGTGYTSVLVTVTNNGDDTIDVNPLYFSITDTDGTKHAAELAADENQIDTVDLAPGENISGTITGKGKFTPKYVTYTDGLLGDPLRADVS
ncbi:DUF4352 domain-containing protein [Streptomyces sp. 15-116A]|uniref:DUF4352 domain-containing protein n=1 Tax=Streptomyces sp. 15-116A TaxID=2259035 RepID=UPI0021B454F0|nr:DUF4352 domain-containing protein [Streptomyces sp. 15-116A]MCT7356005.1 DUF4352 domain-containing protein [Streptomyces sp. 15-116A]